MKKLVIPILFLALVGCQKSNYTVDKIKIPEGYPSTYQKVSSSLLNQKRTDYFNRNSYMSSSLNIFGFCDWYGDPKPTGTPPFEGDISEAEATSIVNDFVSKNLSETGIKAVNELSIYRTNKSTGYAGSIFWLFKYKSQMIDTIEVMFTEIIIDVQNKKVKTCIGNWYPEVYVPKLFNLDKTKAKSVLVGQTVTFGPYAGASTSRKITENDLENCAFSLKVKPIENPDKIELRVCWKIYAPKISYEFYVDVMNGEILSIEPTIIS